MRNLFIIMFITATSLLVAQDKKLIVYPMFNQNSLVIDSLKIDNISKSIVISIGNYGQKESFLINISSSTLGTYNDRTEVESLISLKANFPGALKIKLNDAKTKHIGVKIFSIDGREVSNTQCAYSNELHISIPHNKIYVVAVSTLNGHQSFIVRGSVHNLGFNITNVNVSSNVKIKSQTLINDEEYSVFEGDKLIITGYKNGFLEEAVHYDVVGTDEVYINFEKASVIDIDGNSYKTVKLGTQIWMAENLKVTHYPDNTPISQVQGSDEWKNLQYVKDNDAYCYHTNSAEGEKEKYGAFYTFSAASADNWRRDHKTNQGVCPDGWHLPNNDEWRTLEIYLGESPELVFNNELRIYASHKLKATEGWGSDENGTNSCGFSALPVGLRSSKSGGFVDEGASAAFWLGSQSVQGDVAFRQIFNDDQMYEGRVSNKTVGLSVRCVKDTIVKILPSSNITEFFGIGDSYASCAGFINYEGGTPLIEWGIEISTDKNFPSGSTLIVPGQIRKEYKVSVNAVGLKIKTYHYCRSYATNSIGTAYGDTYRFKTLQANYFSSIAEDPMLFTFSGDAPWFIMEYDMGSIGNNGKARSGMIDKNQRSSVSTQINGSGKISFEWRIDAADRYSGDSLLFYVDNELVKMFDFEDRSRTYEYSVTEPVLHTYTWTFEKNSSFFDEPSSAGQLSNVDFTPSN